MIWFGLSNNINPRQFYNLFKAEKMIRVRPMVTKPEKRVSRVKKANSID